MILENVTARYLGNKEDMDERRTRIFLTKAQIKYLVTMLEIDDPQDAIDAFTEMLEKEGADPTKLAKYVEKIMEKPLPEKK
jgi:hypothetical protein